jgi:hypothetical protein
MKQEEGNEKREERREKREDGETEKLKNRDTEKHGDSVEFVIPLGMTSIVTRGVAERNPGKETPKAPVRTRIWISDLKS